jgi:hypothetical protein
MFCAKAFNRHYAEDYHLCDSLLGILMPFVKRSEYTADWVLSASTCADWSDNDWISFGI